MNLTSLDLEMTFNMTSQLVGLRFPGVAVPPRARVTRAYLQFQADETQSEATSLVIQGQASDNAGTFSVNGYDLSDRARTEASVFWSVPVWELIGEAGEPQQSPDLSSLVQEIVNRPGWESGNAVALVITGTGRRTAVAYDRDPATAARLHVEFGRFDAPMPTRGSAARAEEQPLLEVPRIEFAPPRGRLSGAPHAPGPGADDQGGGAEVTATAGPAPPPAGRVGRGPRGSRVSAPTSSRTISWSSHATEEQLLRSR